jgi:hypothetical protein
LRSDIAAFSHLVASLGWRTPTATILPWRSHSFIPASGPEPVCVDGREAEVLAVDGAVSVQYGDPVGCLPTKAAKEKTITWDQLPKAVQETMHKAAGDHQIIKVEEVTAGDVISYAAEWIDGDNEVEVTVAPDGKLLGRESEPRDDDEGDTEND